MSMKRLLAALCALALWLACAAAEESADALRQAYDAADALWQAGSYLEAAEAFEALGRYEDSVKRARDSKRQWRAETYEAAVALCEAERYAEAQPLFEQLGNYQESRAYLRTCARGLQRQQYERGQALCEGGDYEEALALFTALGDYRDSASWVETCEQGLETQRGKVCYEQGMRLMAAEDWIAARDAFIQAGGYEGATDGLYEAVYQIALQNGYAAAEKELAEENYAAAAQWFEALGDYRDSAARAAEIREGHATGESAQERDFRQALILRSLGDRDGANELFRSLGEYNNAAGYVEEDFPRVTAKALRDAASVPASETFIAPDGSAHHYQIFKIVHTWREAKSFCELLGGHLATLTTPEENAFVYAYMRASGKTTAYFGLYDERRVGNWMWVTGEPLDYLNWHENEPSRSGYERYGMYFYKHKDGTWNDAHFYEFDEVDPGCSFICEWDE